MSDTENRTMAIHRTFNAPIQMVWEAWAQAEKIAQWWGPKGMQTKVIQHDFSAGGIWKYVMTMPGGNEFVTEGVYSEIIVPEKIISSADFKPMTEGVEIQALIEPNRDKTNIIFKVVHSTAEYCKQQEEMGFHKGWDSTFDRLNEYLEADLQ